MVDRAKTTTIAMFDLNLPYDPCKKFKFSKIGILDNIVQYFLTNFQPDPLRFENFPAFLPKIY